MIYSVTLTVIVTDPQLLKQTARAAHELECPASCSFEELCPDIESQISMIIDPGKYYPGLQIEDTQVDGICI